MSDQSAASAIHDIGYQRYTGVRLSRRHVVSALYAHGLRAAFGLGRTGKAKIFPWGVVGILILVAIVVTAIRSQIDQVVLAYPDFPAQVSPLMVLFGAVVGSELVCRDLRSGVLPLYFSRPLRRSDYALARWAALVSAMFLALGGAQLLMFLGAAFDAPTMRAVWHELRLFGEGLVSTGLTALVFASVSLLVAALVTRRAVAAGLVAAAFLITVPVVGFLSVLPSETGKRLAGLASPFTLVGGVADWLLPSSADLDIGGFGPLYAGVTAGLIVGCVGLLLLRYRTVAA